MTIRIDNPSGRNTEARRVVIGGVQLFFSYSTLVAVRSPDGAFRHEHSFSRTTTKHMREMHVDNLECKTDEELQRFARATLFAELAPAVVGGHYALFPLTEIATDETAA